VTYLLDTCVISELVKPRPNPRVVSWIKEQEEESLFLSVITIGEIQKGISKLYPSKRRSNLAAWLQQELPARFAGRVIPINDEVALVWGQMLGDAESKGRRIPVIDAFLAATALVYGFTLVTRNAPDIVDTGASLLNLWEAE